MIKYVEKYTFWGKWRASDQHLCVWLLEMDKVNVQPTEIKTFVHTLQFVKFWFKKQKFDNAFCHRNFRNFL